MALSSREIAKKAALVLQDVSYGRWEIPEMATWINAACRELVRIKPSALTANVGMRLVAGSKQSLAGAQLVQTTDGAAAPYVALQLLEVVRNLGATGTGASAGAAVVGLERKILDVALPGWHSLPATGSVKHVMTDPKDPGTFYVFPQATATPAMYLEVLVSRLPINALTDDATELGDGDIDPGIDASYELPLVHGVLALALAKDGESAAYAQRSLMHQQQFEMALGVKVRNEVLLAPASRPPRVNEAGG